MRAARTGSGANTAKSDVTAAAEKSGNLAGSGANVKVEKKIDPKYGELKWIVEPGGVIHGWNEKNAIEIALTPDARGRKGRLDVQGVPAQSMPVTLRRKVKPISGGRWR